MSSIQVIERAIKRLEEMKADAFPLPYDAVTTGVRGGGHWYLVNADEAVAHVSANDGVDEDQRGPTAILLDRLSHAVDPVLDILRFADDLFFAPVHGEQAAAMVDLSVHLARAVLGETEQ